jgi:hypothetical protein
MPSSSGRTSDRSQMQPSPANWIGSLSLAACELHTIPPALPCLWFVDRAPGSPSGAEGGDDREALGFFGWQMADV